MFNKITLILIVITCMISYNASGQVKFGIETGLNFSQSGVDDFSGSQKTGIRTCFLSGMFFEIHFSKNISIQPGLRYIQRGSKFKNDIVTITQRHEYFEIPLNLNIIINTGKFNPFISAGIYYSGRLSSDQVQDYKTGESYEYDDSKMFNDSDFGAMAGAGLNYKLSKVTELFIAFNYTWGAKRHRADSRARRRQSRAHSVRSVSGHRRIVRAVLRRSAVALVPASGHAVVAGPTSSQPSPRGSVDKQLCPSIRREENAATRGERITCLQKTLETRSPRVGPVFSGAVSRGCF